MSGQEFLFAYLVGGAASFAANALAFRFDGYRLAGRVLFWPAFIFKFVFSATLAAVADIFGEAS